VDDVVLQSIRAGMPPTLDKVPERFRADLSALDRLKDEMLWQIAQTELSDEKSDLYQFFLEKNQQKALTQAESKTLDILREEADLLMFRRSYAFTLLKWRGNRVPNHTMPKSDE